MEPAHPIAFNPARRAASASPGPAARMARRPPRFSPPPTTPTVTSHLGVELIANSPITLALARGTARDGHLRRKPLFDRTVATAAALGVLSPRLPLDR